ncbi:MAG TPA: stage II sporulation protein P [Bacillota bacterium]|nr:stage II sporulation protein P [Bacillota bacterium]
MPFSKNHASFFRALWLCTVGLLVVLAISAGFLSQRNNSNQSVARGSNSTQVIRSLLQLDSQIGRAILRQGIPILYFQDGEGESDQVDQVKPLELFLRLTLNMRYPSPQELIRAQIPIIEWRYAYRSVPAVSNPIITVSSNDDANIEPAPTEPQATVPEGQPQILIYHTHTSECYLPCSGLEHRLNQRGDIVTLGRYLTETLNNMGIATIHSEEIHDQYPFRDSYKRSQKTITNILEENPSLRVVIDLHRDGASVFEKGPEIHGQRAAKIVFVVGSDHMGLYHPHWRRNYQFSMEMADAINRHYPGLVNRVIISDARYNQHLHNHAVIVEIGDQNSRLEEAERSADYLANALKEYLRRYPDTPVIQNTPGSVNGKAVETATHPVTVIR